MRSHIHRILFVALFAMLLPVSPFAALAQAGEDAQLLATYISQVEGVAPVAGPIDGSLSMDGGVNSTASLNTSIADLLIHVDFEVPEVDAGEVWAAAVAFRHTGDQFHYFLLWSDGGWSFSPAGGGNIASGSAPQPGPPGTLVHIHIAAVAENGYVGVDGQYLTTLDLSSQLGEGDIVISANLVGSFDPGDEPVAFTDFLVWPLMAETPVIEPAVTAQPEPTTGPSTVLTTEPADDTTTDPNDEATFNSYLQETAARPDVFGPVDDVLTHEPDTVAFYNTNLAVSDFVARVECIGSRAAVDGFWDCGIVFRDTETGSHYRVAYVSDGYWFLSIGSEEPLQTGTDAPVSISPGDKVVLNLVVVGADGYFGINGEFIARFDLSELPGPGSVDLASAFFNDTYIEGGGLQFDDFVVWSLDSAPAQPDATATPITAVEPSPTEAALDPTPTIPAEETPTTEPTLAADGGIDGTTYVSPAYGYSLSWNDTWVVDSEVSDETGDYLGLNNGVVVVDLIGESWDPASGTCFDRLVEYYEGHASYSDIQFATDTVSANPGIWEITGILTMTFTDEEDGSSTDYINYAACSPVAGQNAMVSLEQFVEVPDFRDQVAAMDELRGSFLPSVETVIVEETPTSTSVAISGETPTSVSGQISTVAGSATFLLGQIDRSGVQGTGTLEAQARLVTVTVIVIGGGAGDVVAIHRGACETINPLDEPDYIVGELDDAGLLREDVSARLALFLSGETYSVVVYSGGDDFSQPLACGQIEG